MDIEFARNLRKQGLTYSEIQQKMGKQLPKSSLSSWCRDIELTPQQQQRISSLIKSNLAKARRAAVESKARLRDFREEQGRNFAIETVSGISLRDAKLALSMLYLGEGYKFPSNRGLKLGSSDPNIVKLYIKLLQICYEIPVLELKCLIGYRVDQDLQLLIDYWSNETGIPRSNFYRSKPDPRTAKKPTLNSAYHGVATVSCKGVSRQLELAYIADAVCSAPIVSAP